MIKRTLALLALALGAAAASAQTTNPYAPMAPLHTGDVLLSLPSSHMPSTKTWEVKFTHRFNQSLSEGSFSDQLHSLFGLDTNADVTFGLSYVIRRDLQLSLSRSNTNDTFEAAAKYLVFQQALVIPVSVAVRGGADVRTERNMDDRTSFFTQAIVSHQFGRKAEVFLIPTFVTNAGRTVSGTSSAAMFDTVFNVPVGVTLMLRPNLSVVAEVTPPNRDLPDGVDANAAWAIGLKRALGGHWFEILLTNSQSTLTDQAVTSTFQGSPLDQGGLHLGFNIERRFGGR